VSAMSEPPATIRPTLPFMFARASHLVALGFGAGLSPIAPGTVGTLWAWAAWRALRLWLSEPALLVLIATSFALGVWACDRTGEDLGKHDHGSMVWDEVVAFWLVLALVPHTLGWQFVAFVLFRFFDVVKPPPIRHFDASLRNGFGVMFDDLLAAFYTLLAVAAIKTAGGG
jgi:phosphatidylglycerophosphatase A